MITKKMQQQLVGVIQSIYPDLDEYTQNDPEALAEMAIYASEMHDPDLRTEFNKLIHEHGPNQVIKETAVFCNY